MPIPAGPATSKRFAGPPVPDKTLKRVVGPDRTKNATMDPPFAPSPDRPAKLDSPKNTMAAERKSSPWTANFMLAVTAKTRATRQEEVAAQGACQKSVQGRPRRKVSPTERRYQKSSSSTTITWGKASQISRPKRTAPKKRPARSLSRKNWVMKVSANDQRRSLLPPRPTVKRAADPIKARFSEACGRNGSP